ncbi:hypothetical protein SJ05684_c19980 [Sinorhizobium sojae CCBAU 05684]|uniref:Uncharacterized protein n=1 Tax=Sinorhizobium sojae CCBAU 05684 TaxID=716928 RepID=A0A249PBW1_9HYPH|nr:hypothetical protein [Sinorhizobium sojae]ASY63440.1 hypothetical protein SJ05684_c19980 [Sinorhizobium sojae CCBAU 05684]
MAALTLSIDDAATSTRQKNGVPSERMLAGRPSRPEDAAPHPGEDANGDFLLSMLSRVQVMIERVVAERRAAKIDRVRVKTRRQLARLPAWVRNDLFPAEQKMVMPSAKTVVVEQGPITLFDGKHQTYSLD